MKPLFLAAILATVSPVVHHPDPGPRDVLDRYSKATRANDADALVEVVDGSAIMYWRDDGRTQALSRYGWESRMRSVAAPSDVQTAVAAVYAGRDGAIARLDVRRGTSRLTDFLLLARTAERWRVVGKVFATASTRPKAADIAAIRSIIERKLDADRRWDGAALTDSMDPRALVFTIEHGELVAASVTEWQARFDDRRRQSTGLVATSSIDSVDVDGDAGAAAWTLTLPDGTRYVDRAILLRTDAGWRMMALLFIQAP